jgi:hypothetical protein
MLAQTLHSLVFPKGEDDEGGPETLPCLDDDRGVEGEVAICVAGGLKREHG